MNVSPYSQAVLRDNLYSASYTVQGQLMPLVRDGMYHNIYTFNSVAPGEPPQPYTAPPGYVGNTLTGVIRRSQLGYNP